MVKLNSKNRATLDALFGNPPPVDIRWADIEALVSALGGTIAPAKGSHRRISLNGKTAIAVRPHPKPIITRGAARALAEFFRKAGVD